MEAAASSPIKLATMGMFIIDTFRFLDPSTGEDLGNKGLADQIGGGGCYFAIGARMFLPPSALQMIIDRGCDWKPQDQAVLDQFNSTASPNQASMWHYRSRPDRTTRAVNIYRGDHRGFDYLSPKIRLEPSDLLQCSPASPPQLPEWIHLICSPERALETIFQIDTILRQKDGADRRVSTSCPKLVYEPIPDSCIAENLQGCLRVLPRLAVFSPNHEEAAHLLGLQDEWERVLQEHEASKQGAVVAIIHFITTKLAGGFVQYLQQHYAQQNEQGQRYGPIICIRSGAWGSVVGQAGIGFHHIPAWHTTAAAKASDSAERIDSSSGKIQDVTGAGNSFLGGFSAYLVQCEQDSMLEPVEMLKEAAIHGAVSASLIIEQLGLPCFELRDGHELWNGHTTAERLQHLRKRLASAS